MEKKSFPLKYFKIPNLNVKNLEYYIVCHFCSTYLQQRWCSLITEGQQSPEHTLCYTTKSESHLGGWNRKKCIILKSTINPEGRSQMDKSDRLQIITLYEPANLSTSLSQKLTHFMIFLIFKSR